MLSEIFDTRINCSDKAENHSIKLAINKQLEETSGKKKAPGKDSKKLWKIGEIIQVIVQNYTVNSTRNNKLSESRIGKTGSGSDVKKKKKKRIEIQKEHDPKVPQYWEKATSIEMYK